MACEQTASPSNRLALPLDTKGFVTDFFPATSDGFVAKCGTIAAVKVSDFDDVHRRRHLQSFQKSWIGMGAGFLFFPIHSYFGVVLYFRMGNLRC